MLGLGHRRVGHILGPAEYLCTRERYDGYCRALREAGLEPDPRMIWQGDFTPEGGRECAHAICSQPADVRPEALFVDNDQMAFGLLDVAPQYGLHIPEDMSVIGFDDMPMARFAKPALTTIRQPHREMGEFACELLLSLIDPKNYSFQHGNETFSRTEEGGSKHLRVVLPTKLIVRDSCGVTQSVP